MTTDDTPLAITVWKFDSATGAAESAQRLEASGVEVGAAVVSWAKGTRTPRAETLEAGAGTESFWGLFFGLVFFMPLIGAAVGGTTGTRAGMLSDLGIDDSFINRIRDRITPGTSALFTLSSGSEVTGIRAALTPNRWSEVMFTNLTSEQAQALSDVFGHD